jgi:hypothetical protein
MIKLSPLALFASVILSLVGCTNEDTQDTGSAADNTALMAPGHPESMGQQNAGSSGNIGRVLSTLEVPGYTYMEVDKGGSTVWLAGSPTEVAEGETVSWETSTVMKNFYSKTLARTFDEVIFVSRISKASSQPATAMPAGHPVAATPAPVVEAASQGMVISTQNAANYTYLEVKTADDSVIWLAAPETTVNVNDTVSWQRGSLMTNFASSTLGKTFPEIYFVTAVQINN